ncbi:hypothetical protein, partial [Janibacter melonis]|uniref:hypothetical protein n=1 Tax=Janibacter melonis TaxID=262209 RepID=UPI0020941B53
MSVQQGMDTARIREIAEQLRSQREKIEGVRQSGSTSAKVLRDSWAGADLSGFTERWDGPVVKQLMDAATQIGAAADLMVQQATDQDDTSSLGGGSGSGPGAGGPGAGSAVGGAAVGARGAGAAAGAGPAPGPPGPAPGLVLAAAAQTGGDAAELGTRAA